MGKSDRGSRSGRLTVLRLTSSQAFRSERLHFGFERVDAASISLDRFDQTVYYRAGGQYSVSLVLLQGGNDGALLSSLTKSYSTVASSAPNPVLARTISSA